MKYGVDPSRGKPDTDFGQGFYTTTWERQARAWAWYRALSAPLSVSPANPVVVCFTVDRQDLAGLETLAFVSGDYHERAGFWSLVEHCRQSKPPVVRNHKCTNSQDATPNNWYDLVVGPAAAFWWQRVAMTDADQYSFHTKRAARVLNNLIAQYQLGINRTRIFMDWVAST